MDNVTNVTEKHAKMLVSKKGPVWDFTLKHSQRWLSPNVSIL